MTLLDQTEPDSTGPCAAAMDPGDMFLHSLSRAPGNGPGCEMFGRRCHRANNHQRRIRQVPNNLVETYCIDASPFHVPVTVRPDNSYRTDNFDLDCLDSEKAPARRHMDLEEVLVARRCASSSWRPNSTGHNHTPYESSRVNSPARTERNMSNVYTVESREQGSQAKPQIRKVEHPPLEHEREDVARELLRIIRKARKVKPNQSKAKGRTRKTGTKRDCVLRPLPTWAHFIGRLKICGHFTHFSHEGVEFGYCIP